MAFKVNIGSKGKTWKVETESEALIGVKIGEKIYGKDVSPELEGYELEIMGASDLSGFPAFKEIEGDGLKRVILTKGKGLKRKPKGLKKKRRKMPQGMRFKKTIRGNTISRAIAQINTKVLKQGGKKLEEIFPEQNKKKEAKTEAPAVAPAQ